MKSFYAKGKSKPNVELFPYYWEALPSGFLRWQFVWMQREEVEVLLGGG